jgi:muramoyltetrapeptide carboxypeptidase
LVGFSDVTTLHQAVAGFLGLVTLFGPMPATVAIGGDSPEHETIDHLRRTLFQPESVQCLTGPAARCLVPGVAEGVLVGGTLSLLSASVGTAEHRPAVGGLALLEDVGEPTYRLDSHLTQLLRTGWFDGVKGIALGSWRNCDDAAGDLVASRLRHLGVPLVTGFPFGHCSPSITVPLGMPASLDASAASLTLAAPALAAS